ncbi:unknown similar to AMEV264 [Choristoneura biennis entomopoxvirus]|uniref:Uncharacterized protein n=1 Tax=Choristoneura biennis entomopoxvirus TaxID=10288 RepID=A0A916P6N0_CBEPV|nr:unknown similar to AMEV264 [Choristoneura biennis entomopoxvirus]CCU55635.1 unknown similar to AMEV264 [Choristoneura biennis entomopoxvirus]
MYKILIIIILYINSIFAKQINIDIRISDKYGILFTYINHTHYFRLNDSNVITKNKICNNTYPIVNINDIINANKTLTFNNKNLIYDKYNNYYIYGIYKNGYKYKCDDSTSEFITLQRLPLYYIPNSKYISMVIDGLKDIYTCDYKNMIYNISPGRYIVWNNIDEFIYIKNINTTIINNNNLYNITFNYNKKNISLSFNKRDMTNNILNSGIYSIYINNIYEENINITNEIMINKRHYSYQHNVHNIHNNINGKRNFHIMLLVIIIVNITIFIIIIHKIKNKYLYVNRYSLIII